MSEADNYPDVSVRTYVLKIKDDPGRSHHITQQFKNREEFDIKIIETAEFESKALWGNIVEIIEDATLNEDDVIIICQDNHCFTDEYSKEYLISNIIEASEQGALLLSGGITDFDHVVPLTVNRYWIDRFSSLCFLVLFKHIFHRILSYKLKRDDTPVKILSEITSHKMLLYPSISEQAGYNDENKSFLRLKKVQAAFLKYNVISS